MKPQNPDKTSLIKVYKITFQSLKANPLLLAPFAIFALIEFIALVIVFLSPHVPLRSVLGPIIKTLWGENFLHYPYNFLLLPRLMATDRMFLSIIFSSLLTGMAVAIISSIYNRKPAKLGESFKSALKNYISLFCIVLVLTIVYFGLTKLTGVALVKYFMAGHTRLLFVGPRAWFGPILMVINFALGILIQAAFVYAIPILIIEKTSLLKSIARSFILFLKLFIPTVILVTIPILTYIPIVIIQDNTAIIIDKLFPELILLACVIAIIVNALIDLIITTSCTFLYLNNKGQSR
jgi:hypothetical protein